MERSKEIKDAENELRELYKNFDSSEETKERIADAWEKFKTLLNKTNDRIH